MSRFLDGINDPQDLKKLSKEDLPALAAEIRNTLLETISKTGGHLGSNLGVVELTMALHYVFDSPRDKFVWDVGHQSYVHKLLTGRRERFDTLRQYDGLSGFTKREENEHDHWNCGHGGTSISAALAFAKARDLKKENNQVVAIIGDGSLTAGMAFEGLNHTGHLKSNMIVILNDNEMSISPNIGAMSHYFNQILTTNFYNKSKKTARDLIKRTLGDKAVNLGHRIQSSIKDLIVGEETFFEKMGIRYLGPVDGHNIRQMQKYLAMGRDFDGPVLLHAVTEKGHGFQPAAEDPVYFHTPAPFSHENGQTVSLKKKTGKPYTQLARNAILGQMACDDRVAVITAAMCQGNMLEPIREQFPERFYDVGICESHAVAFAAGLAKTGMRPVVDIYSTFLQRSYDQIFQEASLQFG